jgi:threonine dehydrogenase-like Zn-dependent dehydrogenase
MRAVVCQDARLEVVDLPEPVPGPGQLLVEVRRCGICGSDLHARHHCDELAGVMDELGYDGMMRRSQAVVLGHEFCGEVVDRGPRTKGGPADGDLVVALPLLRGADGAVHPTGLSAAAAGGYAERLLVQAACAITVPNGLPPEVATLTEPLAVAWHAVRRGEVGKRQVAIVIGCGPVGLAVILLLKAQGVRRVVAADLSPGRRALAQRCGADVVVDPATASPYAAFPDAGHLTTAPDVLELAVGTQEKLVGAPIPTWGTWRAIDRLGIRPKAPVVFECVGVPGMIDAVVAGAPIWSRVVVVGVCMGEDRLRPTMAINKEVELRFVLGYTPLEFRDALHLLAEGRVDPSPLVTGTVGLDGVGTAFEALGDPETHAKILVDPRSAATAP